MMSAARHMPRIQTRLLTALLLHSAVALITFIVLLCLGPSGVFSSELLANGLFFL